MTYGKKPCYILDMSILLSIGEASKALGVTIQTLRNWDKNGILKPDEFTRGGERRYRLESIKNINKNITYRNDDLRTIAYARVNTQKDNEYLVKQVEALEKFCDEQGFEYEVIQDVGSGVSSYKNGLMKLINALIENKVKRLVITSPDRLLRFGAEIIFSICRAKNIEIIITNQLKEDFDQENEILYEDIKDVVEIFSARLYGSQNPESKNVLNCLKKAIHEK